MARRARRRVGQKFIQKTGIGKPGHKGALHRALGVPEGEHIPEHLLQRATKAKGKLGYQARFYANVLRKLPHHIGPLGSHRTRRAKMRRRAHHSHTR